MQTQSDHYLQENHCNSLTYKQHLTTIINWVDLLVKFNKEMAASLTTLIIVDLQINVRLFLDWGRPVEWIITLEASYQTAFLLNSRLY
jgi:hypothetical protein